MNIDPPRTAPVSCCPVCGGGGSSFMTDLPDFLHGTAGRFSYSRCSLCGSVYQDPRIVEEDLGRIYPQDYYTHEATPATAADEPRTGGRSGLRNRTRDCVRQSVRRRLLGEGGGVSGWLFSGFRALREGAFRGLIDPLLPQGGAPGKALEIGPGSGWELRLLSEAGWQIEGLEWDPVAAENAAASSGVRVHHGGVPSGLPDSKWDLIYLSHVFEHVSEPGEIWRLLIERLSPGGRLVIVVPNPRSLGARLWGRDWFAWDPPRHLCLTTRNGFERLADGLPGRLKVRSRARISHLIHDRSRERRGGGLPDFVTAALGFVEGLLGELGVTAGDELIVVFEKAAAR